MHMIIQIFCEKYEDIFDSKKYFTTKWAYHVIEYGNMLAQTR